MDARSPPPSLIPPALHLKILVQAMPCHAVGTMPCEPLLAFPASWNTIHTQPRPAASGSKPDEKPPWGMAASTLHWRATAERRPHLACISVHHRPWGDRVHGRKTNRPSVNCGMYLLPSLGNLQGGAEGKASTKYEVRSRLYIVQCSVL